MDVNYLIQYKIKFLIVHIIDAICRKGVAQQEVRITFELNNLYNMDCMKGMEEIPDKYFYLAM